MRMTNTVCVSILGSIFILVSTSYLPAAEIYTWTDKDGNLHITEHPPPKGAKLKEVTTYSGKPDPRKSDLQKSQNNQSEDREDQNKFKETDEVMEVIQSVGPGGHYLREKHTRKHMRDFHYSPIFRQLDSDGNLREPREMAIEGFNQIYETHFPEPLPESKLKEMDRILEAADQKAKALGG